MMNSKGLNSQFSLKSTFKNDGSGHEGSGILKIQHTINYEKNYILTSVIGLSIVL